MTEHFGWHHHMTSEDRTQWGRAFSIKTRCLCSLHDLFWCSLCVWVHVCPRVVHCSRWEFSSSSVPLRCFHTERSTDGPQLQVSVTAHQLTHRDHLSNYTKVALTPSMPRHDQMTPLSLPSVQAHRRLMKQKQHRLWLLCDFAGTAGRDAVTSLRGPTSHMTLSGCENAVIARMLSWVSHNLGEMCCRFTHFAVGYWLHTLRGSHDMTCLFIFFWTRHEATNLLMFSLMNWKE